MLPIALPRISLGPKQIIVTGGIRPMGRGERSSRHGEGCHTNLRGTFFWMQVSVSLNGLKRNGEVSERFKEHAWKACVGETQPWVQIPPSPPLSWALRQKVAQSAVTRITGAVRERLETLIFSRIRRRNVFL